MKTKNMQQMLGIEDERPYWQRVTDFDPRFPHFAAKDDNGGGGEEDDDEDEEDDDDQDEDDDDDDKEVTIKSGELKKIRAALESANAEAKKRKLELRRIKNEGKNQSESKVQEAVSTAEKKYKTPMVHALAKAGLLSAGFDGEVSKSTLKLIDMDEIEVDEDGDVIGLDDEIDRIKKEYPKLFKPERKAPPKVTKGKVSVKTDDDEDEDDPVARKLYTRR